MKKVAVFGLGYVGCVTAACLSRDGHTVLGVDIDADKVGEVNAGIPPITEPGLDELLQQEVQAGRFRATTDGARAVQETDMALIAVGTPSADDGSVTVQGVERVVRSIGEALKGHSRPYHVVVRSTLLPGILEEQLAPALAEAAGRPLGRELVLCNNPEFLRESSAVKDYYNPPFVLVGADDENAAAAVLDLYHAVEAERFVTDTRAASLVKYACNAFHAMKVAFANEIGSLAKSLGANGHDVMKLVCQDTKLNISPAYLRPGFAFGGSCLPKDVRALTRFAEREAVRLPMLASILPSNEAHLKRALKLIRDSGHRKIGIVGLSFKAGTDDLRESPMVELVETLLGWGFDIRIYDPNISLTRLRGKNLTYIDRHLPHLASMLVSDLAELVSFATAIVTAHDVAKLEACVPLLDTPIIDLRSVLATPTSHLNEQRQGASY